MGWHRFRWHTRKRTHALAPAAAHGISDAVSKYTQCGIRKDIKSFMSRSGRGVEASSSSSYDDYSDGGYSPTYTHRHNVCNFVRFGSHDWMQLVHKKINGGAVINVRCDSWLHILHAVRTGATLNCWRFVAILIHSLFCCWVFDSF